MDWRDWGGKSFFLKTKASDHLIKDCPLIQNGGFGNVSQACDYSVILKGDGFKSEAFCAKPSTY
jgi:hypothetical protein